jgi:hypothetical protein
VFGHNGRPIPSSPFQYAFSAVEYLAFVERTTNYGELVQRRWMRTCNLHWPRVTAAKSILKNALDLVPLPNPEAPPATPLPPHCQHPWGAGYFEGRRNRLCSNNR